MNQGIEIGLPNDMRQSFLENHIPNIVRYNGDLTFDASPTPVTLFLDGQAGHSLALPPNSQVLMNIMFSATRVDIDNSHIAFIRQVGYTRNKAGTTLAAMTLTGAQNISIAPNLESLTVQLDNTTGEIKLAFAGAANSKYKFACSVQLNGIAQQSRFPTIFKGEG